MPDPLPDPAERPEIDLQWLTPGESSRPTSSPAPTTGWVEGYEVEGEEPSTETASARPIPPVALPTARPGSKGKAAGAARRLERRPSSGVSRTWNRTAEWGPSMLLLGVGMAGAAFLLYSTFSLNALILWAILLLGCTIGLSILAYPIFITLERPVRVTPEQAIKDYFGAFSHLVPHTRRMWLLLSDDGRAPFHDSLAEFRAHWRGRLATWKAEAKAVGPFNPLEIEVGDFKSDKSAGQTEVEASYSARVVRRGQAGESVATYRVTLRLVKGGDKMWYLEAGTLD